MEFAPKERGAVLDSAYELVIDALHDFDASSARLAP